MYKAMTTLCKLVEEPVYSLKMFLKIVDAIVSKVRNSNVFY